MNNTKNGLAFHVCLHLFFNLNFLPLPSLPLLPSPFLLRVFEEDQLCLLEGMMASNNLYTRLVLRGVLRNLVRLLFSAPFLGSSGSSVWDSGSWYFSEEDSLTGTLSCQAIKSPKTSLVQVVDDHDSFQKAQLILSKNSQQKG